MINSIGKSVTLPDSSCFYQCAYWPAGGRFRRETLCFDAHLQPYPIFIIVKSIITSPTCSRNCPKIPPFCSRLLPKNA